MVGNTHAERAVPRVRPTSDLTRALGTRGPLDDASAASWPGHPDLFDLGVGQGGPYALTATADGALWISLIHHDAVVRLHPSEGRSVVDLVPGPASRASRSQPAQLAPVSVDAVVVACLGDDTIRRVTATGATTITRLAPGSAPYGVGVAPDGAIWYTASGTSVVGRLIDGHEPLERATPLAAAFPSMLTVDDRGDVLYTMNAGDAVGAVTAAGSHSVVAALPQGAGPVGIASDGSRTWIVEFLAGAVATLVGDELTHVALPAGSRPHAGVVGPRGELWVTLWGADGVARVQPDGRTDVFGLPAGSEPHGLSFDVRGNLWVALESGRLARIDAATVDLTGREGR